MVSPPEWSDYELLDSGSFEKLERFGAYCLRRPEPQAVWPKALSEGEWSRLAQASFVRDKGRGPGADAGERGSWVLRPGMPQQWFMSYRYGNMLLRFRLGLTAFKHVGLFPEQASNWNYIYDFTSSMKGSRPRVLNLFAYTGGASLAACAAGAEVTHLDSVRQVVTWTRENMEASGLDGIRWMVDDALKFLRRETKRGNLYSGIILDPPAYGRGPEGEKWVLEEGMDELMSLCGRLLEPSRAFVVLNLYSMGYSSLIADNLVRCFFPGPSRVESGELFVPDRAGRRLPLGVFARLER